MVETFDCTNTSLRRGSKGAKVSLLQTHLKTLGFYLKSGGSTLKVDGDYGVYTEQAVKAFQKSVGGLALDGWFGPVTCKKLNEKILAKEDTTKKAESSAKKTATTTTVTTPKVDPYAPNPKNNVFPKDIANLDIDGIYFVVSSVTRTNPYHSGAWKSIQLMNGKNYFYKDRPSPLEYSLDCYVENYQYGTLSSELNKMGERICKVVTTLFPSGYYMVDVNVADEKVKSKKITLKLLEYMS